MPFSNAQLTGLPESPAHPVGHSANQFTHLRMVVESLEREAAKLRPLLPLFDDAGRSLDPHTNDIGRCSANSCSIQRYLDAVDQLPSLHAWLLRAWAKGTLESAATDLGISPQAAKRCVHRANAAITTLLARMPLY